MLLTFHVPVVKCSAVSYFPFAFVHISTRRPFAISNNDICEREGDGLSVVTVVRQIGLQDPKGSFTFKLRR